MKILHQILHVDHTASLAFKEICIRCGLEIKKRTSQRPNKVQNHRHSAAQARSFGSFRTSTQSPGSLKHKRLKKQAALE
jgi:hypothetical protein